MNLDRKATRVFAMVVGLEMVRFLAIARDLVRLHVHIRMTVFFTSISHFCAYAQHDLCA
jgi:hypothetical protein